MMATKWLLLLGIIFAMSDDILGAAVTPTDQATTEESTIEASTGTK